MLQDILPHVYHSDYAVRKPGDDDIMILQIDNQVLLVSAPALAPSSDGMKEEQGGEAPDAGCGFQLPTVSLIRKYCPGAAEHAFYLFSIDEQGYYSAPASSWEQDLKKDGRDILVFKSVMVLREMEKAVCSFSGAVGWQLANWYDLHRFCGRCGRETVHSEQERAIICPSCGHAYYPRISPVVIIAIVDFDRILLTRYNRSGYRRHALVAGFVEIGETLEDAVRREVMEEVGLRVKNIRYIESQPWPFSSSLIAGFSAEVDGDPTVHLNTDGGEELSEAVWMERSEVEIEDGSISLTWDMIRKFKNGTL